jgi:glycosyltransferase involved in cell wall biosynthesis
MTQIKTVKTLHVLFTGLVTRGMVSGGDQLFIDIAPRLPKTLKIKIILPEFGAELWKGKPDNVELIKLKTNFFDFKDHPFLIFLSYLVRSFQAYRILRKEKVEAIYSCSDIAYADIWPAFLVTKDRKIKWLTRVYHVLLSPQRRQGSFLTNIFAFYLQRLSFWMMKKRSTQILALNQKLYGELMELGFPKETMGILGAGIDFKRIHEFKPTRKYDYDVVVLGRIAPVKGIFDAVKIWSKVHQVNKDWRLAWIGGGAEHYQSKLKSMLEENGLEESFKLLGFLEKSEVYNILKSAKVFLCTDHENGWGLAVCEAMSAGLPVVAYDIDIFGGVYKQGFLSAPLFNTDKFAQKLIKLLENDKERQKLAREAVEQASEFDHQIVINDLRRYLEI